MLQAVTRAGPYTIDASISLWLQETYGGEKKREVHDLDSPRRDKYSHKLLQRMTNDIRLGKNRAIPPIFKEVLKLSPHSNLKNVGKNIISVNDDHDTFDPYEDFVPKRQRIGPRTFVSNREKFEMLK